MREYKDTLGGILMIVIAVAFMIFGTDYRLGTLQRMGPGFFPLIASGLLVVLGSVILLKGLLASSPPRHVLTLKVRDLRPIVFVFMGLLSFGFLLERVGVLISSFILVVLSALSSGEIRPLRIAILAVILPLCVLALFNWGLGMRLPLFRWPS